MAKDTKIKDTKRVIIDDLFGTELGDKCFVSITSEYAITKSREYIPLMVDEACVEPCRVLYDMGIRTVNSGANVDGKDNVSYFGFIGIDYKSLSDENKLIADKLEERKIIDPIKRDPNVRGNYIVYLPVPLTSNSLVLEVETQLMKLVNLFQPQDVLYGRKTRNELESEYKENEDGTYFCPFLHTNISYEDMQLFIQEDLENFYYDGDKYYYLTEELLDIHLNYINKESNYGRKNN